MKNYTCGRELFRENDAFTDYQRFDVENYQIHVYITYDKTVAAAHSIRSCS